ncbi:FecR family protein [Hephaestia mangrovi]|uniref:FecR family protein n=1 Tax=Hephaestia mangrovi TaxID=2873268 RepID=UPI001CA6E649|nr:FecR domain-containing protein [Hephaestia mangrovi]MBY8826598.1 FecR domain-containing protein [Hephaestia mangrovi]
MTESASDMHSEAALWVARMDRDQWDDDHEAELQFWLDADPRHHGALLRAQAAWMTLDEPRIGPEAAVPRFARRAVLAGGGTAIAASIAGGILWLGNGTRYTTKVGETRRVPLDDGSIAAINTQSAVEIDYSPMRRDVRLDRGEAWFQVAKNPKRPFVVEAGRVRAEAVGTAFSVRLKHDGAEVLVTEGVVEAWASGADGHRVRLLAGERAFIADDAAIIREPTPPSSVDRALAWRSGKIDLVGEPLANAVAEFNRYNTRQITLADPALSGLQFDGVFRTDDPEGFALAVKRSLGVPVDFSGRDTIRIGSARR